MIATLIGLCITAKHIAIQVLVRRSTGIGDVTQATCRTVHGACLVSLQHRLCHIVFLCHIILIRCSLTKPFCGRRIKLQVNCYPCTVPGNMVSLKPSRVPQEVSQWLTQWQDYCIKPRYLFLVLDGPARMGMTTFVQTALVEHPTEALILNCSDVDGPVLQANFDSTKHLLVLFDEAPVEMITRNKRIFQPDLTPVTVDSSLTSRPTCAMWLHGTKMVVCSNSWREQVRGLSDMDRNWIEQNSVYVYVDSPLWTEGGLGGS